MFYANFELTNQAANLFHHNDTYRIEGADPDSVKVVEDEEAAYTDWSGSVRRYSATSPRPFSIVIESDHKSENQDGSETDHSTTTTLVAAETTTVTISHHGCTATGRDHVAPFEVKVEVGDTPLVVGEETWASEHPDTGDTARFVRQHFVHPDGSGRTVCLRDGQPNPLEPEETYAPGSFKFRFGSPDFGSYQGHLIQGV